jgi:hypothetical protein
MVEQLLLGVRLLKIKGKETSDMQKSSHRVSIQHGRVIGLGVSSKRTSGKALHQTPTVATDADRVLPDPNWSINTAVLFTVIV